MGWLFDLVCSALCGGLFLLFLLWLGGFFDAHKARCDRLHIEVQKAINTYHYCCSDIEKPLMFPVLTHQKETSE